MEKDKWNIEWYKSTTLPLYKMKYSVYPNKEDTYDDSYTTKYINCYINNDGKITCIS